MAYIELYSDGATDEEIQLALENFMKTHDSFEASSWAVSKLDDGRFLSECCTKHPGQIYNILAEWQEDHCVYPDQEQWVEDD